MNRFLIALMMTAIAGSAYAALDDTKEQMEKRYGKPVEEPTAVLPATYVAIYQKGDLKIRANYLGGRAQHIKYSGKIGESDIDAVLKANQIGAQPWVKFSEKKGASKPRMGSASRCWTCPLGAEAHMEYSRSSRDVRFIEFATDTWLKAKNAGF